MIDRANGKTSIEGYKKTIPRYNKCSCFCTFVYERLNPENIIHNELGMYSLDDLNINEEIIINDLHSYQDNIGNKSKFMNARPCNMYSVVFDRDGETSAGNGTYQLVCNGIIITKYNLVSLHAKVGDIRHIKNIINSFTPLGLFEPIPDNTDPTQIKYKTGTEFKSCIKIGHSVDHILNSEMDRIYSEVRDKYVTTEFIICGDFNVELPDTSISKEDIGCREYENVTKDDGLDNILKIGKYER